MSLQLKTTAGNTLLSIASAPGHAASTFILRCRISAYADFYELFSMSSQGFAPNPYFVGLESKANGTMHIHFSDVSFGYLESNVWTDSYAGWFDFALTFSSGAQASYYRRQSRTFTVGPTITSDTTFTMDRTDFGSIIVDTAGRNGTVQYDRILIYSSALTAFQCRQQFDSARPLYSKVWAWYPDMRSEPTRTKDASGRSRHLSVTGTTLHHPASFAYARPNRPLVFDTPAAVGDIVPAVANARRHPLLLM